ncbi:MAG: ROK family protein [Terracidiphilus sp.]
MNHNESRGSDSTLDDNHAFLSPRYVAGVDIGGTNLRVALADAAGNILGKWAASTPADKGPESAVDLIREGVDRLLDEQRSSRDHLLAIAAGAPGITDVDRGVVIATSYLLGWSEVPLRDLLESSLGVPAVVDNDVNMAAFGEARAGIAKDTNNFVFLAIGTGVGAGIVINRQLFRGDTWTAGEVGYLLVPGTSVAPVELDQPGALESLVGGEGIRSQWRSRCTSVLSSRNADLNATQIFDLALQGDPPAQEVLDLASRTLAYGVCNIAMILDCRLVVLGGSVGLHPALANATRAHLAVRGAQYQLELKASSLGPEAQITGAVFQALEIAQTGAAEKAPVAVELVSDSANSG